MITFEACDCGKGPHGYLTKEGDRLPVVIISVAAARYLVDQIKDEETELVGRESDIEEQVRAAGIPENVDDDINYIDEGIAALVFSRMLTSSAEDLDDLDG